MNVLSVRYRNNREAPLQFISSIRDTGFAVITDHPISQTLVSEVFAEWKAFFESEIKHRYTFKQETQAGYFPFRTENAKNSAVKDLKEFYHYHDWGTLPENVSSKSRELFDQMTALAVELLGWLDDHTPPEIRREFSTPLRDMIQGSRETLLRPIHYPPLTGGEEQGAIRAAAHEDINLITILPAATAAGLEVQDKLGNWHQVSCDPGQLAINAGDMLQMASQGFYKSTTHRVVNPMGPEAKLPRYSMPLFLHPRSDVRLSPEHTAGSYLNERLREIGLKPRA